MLEKERNMSNSQLIISGKSPNELQRLAECINTIGRFCGTRDVTELSREALFERYQFRQAELMVLFGGSILCGGDVLAMAMQNAVAKIYMIVGGQGHTTETLRQVMQNEVPGIQAANMFEAELFSEYLNYKYGLRADLLETKSTNCGNNVTNCLALLRRHQIAPEHILIVQDASMQRRMEAGFKKYLDEEITIVNFAAYEVRVIHTCDRLCYDKEIPGMWSIKQYITLLMGEIPRLTDNVQGYGPKGKNYIAHVDIPQEVQAAFTELSREFASLIRTAEGKYAHSPMQAPR